MAGGQCLAFNLDRLSHQVEPENLNKVNYVWVNDDFKLDTASIINGKLLKEIETYKRVYYNEKTGTSIYKIK